MIESAQALLEAEQLNAAREARLSSPEAVAEREASRTKYESLSRNEAAGLAEKFFHVQKPSWSSPVGEDGDHLVKYSGETSAIETTPGGQHVLLQSTIPLRSAVGTGQPESVSLALEDDGRSLAPANPLVPISISKSEAGAVSFPYGVGVAPAQNDAPEAPAIVGHRVFYPQTATDTDLMVEPQPQGAELSWLLRSQASPQNNALRFSLPAGAALQMSAKLPGAVEVVKEGQTLLMVPPAGAITADGSSLPVSYSISGDTLTTHVDLGGNVAFPVLVDPLIAGYYGSMNNAYVWHGWHTYSNCGCFSFVEHSEVIWTEALVSEPSGDWGEWYIDAPGGGAEGGASITRVDVSEMGHQTTGESIFQAEIGQSNGSDPVYTFNGYEGAMGKSPLLTEEAYYRAVAFCAQGEGGKDGSYPGLCDETAGGTFFRFEDVLNGQPFLYSNYSEIFGAAITYLDNTSPNEVRLEGLPKGWVKKGPSSMRIYAHDQGTGVGAFEVERPAYKKTGNAVYQYEESCKSAYNGFTGCPQAAYSPYFGLQNTPTGAWELGVYGLDAVGNWREEEIGPSGEELHGSKASPMLYVDEMAPKIASLGGSLKEANGTVIGSGNYTLTFSAEDGSGSAPQSGVKSIEVKVDGSKVSEVVTSCAEPLGSLEQLKSACYGLSGSWTMEGAKYGAGIHTVQMTAKDRLGNVAVSEAISVTVNEAPYRAMGPGVVNLKSGDYKLTAVDVAVAGPGSELTLGRSYDSRQLTAGATGPLGPQWSLSVPDAAANGVWQSLSVLANGSVQATAANGVSATFAANGSAFVSPAGYQTVSLTKTSSSPLEYRLTDAAGNATIFMRPGGSGETGPLVPSGVVQASGAGGLNKVTYTFTKTAEGITEPTEVIGPPPPNVSCPVEPAKPAEALKAGCRALTFNYASSTTAKGEAPSEWGDYKGYLTRVYFTAFNPATKAMKTVEVAHYLYDSRGRLRTVWDPQTEPEPEKCVKEPLAQGCLATIYGYDTEGHITALTAPGQETWVFTYGTTSGDSNAGRLLKVLQASVSAEVWKGELLKDTEAPRLSGSPVVGVRMAVSDGLWSPTPVSYRYQWEDCNSIGGECKAILGANNPNYKPVSSDVGHTLVVQVTATNGGGSVVASTTASAVVVSTAGSYTQSVDSGSSLNAVSCVTATTDCVGSDSKGNAFYATNVSVSSSASWKSWSGPGTSPSEAVNCATTSLCLLADGSDSGNGGNLYYATSLGGSWTQAYSPAYGVDAISCVSSSFCVDGQDGQGYFRYSTTPASTSWTLEEQGTSSMNAVFCLSASFCAIADSTGNVHVANTTSQVESSAWASTDVDATTALKGVSCTSTTSCIVVDGVGSVLNLAIGSNGAATAAKHDIDGTNNLTAVTCSGSTCVAVDSQGNVFVSTNNGETWIKQLTLLFHDLTSVSCASSSLCAAADTSGNVTSFNPQGVTVQEGEVRSPQPGETVEYSVPLSGSGLKNMTKAEVEKWAQKDIPVEASAIFPPDESQSWPATDYKRAVVYYLDNSNRTVDVATPSGGISTTEYDQHDNVTRTLSADNRATALNEGIKSAEVAKQLDTQSTYSGDGTELTSTLGPEHKIKLPSGSEVQARKQVQYTYDEGAPETGGPYRLVTSTKESALVSGKEEDARTVKNTYSSGSNLGWKLHVPTSTVVDPENLKLTHATEYSPTTGNVLETRMPAASSGGELVEYALPTGSAPFGITSGPDGNLWFTDAGTGKAGKITTSGAITEYASEHNRPEGITSGPDGNLWFVEHEIRNVDHMTTSGALTVYTLTHTGTYNVGIVTGPDSNMWFTESEDNDIGKITTKDEVLAEYALPAGSRPYGITKGPDGNLWFTEYGTSKVGKITTSGVITEYALPSGSQPYTIVNGPDGNLWFTEYGTSKVGKITTSGVITEYALPSGSQPEGIASGPEGNLWVAEYGASKLAKVTTGGSISETALPAGSKPQGIVAGPDGNIWFTEEGTSKIGKIGTTVGSSGAHDSQIIYYSPGTEASVATCQNHPEWANLPCQTQPVHQPEVSGLPGLPVTTYTYNLWDEPEVAKSAVKTSTGGEATRTDTTTYDSAGRTTSKEMTSTTGTPLPKVSYQYSPVTGLLVAQSTGSGESEQKITSTYNALGQMTSYTDAGGNTTKYEYEGEGAYQGEKEKDGRLRHTDDGKGTQTYSYDQTTGEMTELVDPVAGTFTASYDVEGMPLTEKLPDGLTASITYNAVGEPTGLEYTKKSYCGTSCTWFTDTVVPSIHGQWLSQTSTLSGQSYSYDSTGRLTQVQTTPTGKGCSTRVYAYDQDGNRTNLTTRPPNSENKCATEGGTTETHTYDAADRLIDPGTAYDAFGDIETVSEANAGGSPLTSTYYSDGQVESQEQNTQRIGYTLDPARRTRETISTGKITATEVQNYSGPGNTPSWSSEPSGNWTRNIPGIGGGLEAIEHNGETPVLQLSNLHGDIVATAYDSETATELASTIGEANEYGVPATEAPPKYSWLGLHEIPTELPSGVTAMGARSYVPQLGRFLQPDPSPGGSSNAYSYTYGNPLNETDLSGAWTLAESAGVVGAGGTGEGVHAETGIAVGAIMPPPPDLAAEQAMEANPPWDQATAGAEEYAEYEEEWEEEWEEEYASYHHGRKADKTEADRESGLLYQPLSGEGGSDESTTRRGSALPLCKQGSEGPCGHEVCFNNGGYSGHKMECHAGRRPSFRTSQCVEFNQDPRCRSVYLGRYHDQEASQHRATCVNLIGAAGGLVPGPGKAGTFILKVAGVDAARTAAKYVC